MTGKEKCKLLKQIRKEIAEKNGIAYEPAKCDYVGECLGTCRKCDEEIRYLDRQLNKKAQMGGHVRVAGLQLNEIEIDRKQSAMSDGFGGIPPRRDDGIYRTMGIILPPIQNEQEYDEDLWGDDSEEEEE